MFEPIPDDVTIDDVRREYAEAKVLMAPAAPGVAEREAATVVASLGVPHGADPRAYALALTEALADLPDDLVKLACKRARTGCKYPPRPAEVVEKVADERAVRRRRLSRAELAGKKLARDGQPMRLPPSDAPDRSAEVLARLAQAGGGAVKRMP